MRDPDPNREAIWNVVTAMNDAAELCKYLAMVYALTCKKFPAPDLLELAVKELRSVAGHLGYDIVKKPARIGEPPGEYTVQDDDRLEHRQT
jgi:hypothetical protein